MQIKLEEYPFTRPLFEDLPQRAPLDPVSKRQSIRSKLHSEMSLSNSDFEFLEEYPEEARWLKDHIEARFWLNYESLAKSREDQK